MSLSEEAGRLSDKAIPFAPIRRGARARRKRRSFCAFSVATILAAAAGCTIPVMQLTLGATKGFDVNGRYEKVASGARGESMVTVVLLIPFGRAPSWEDAIEQAMDSVGGGDAMTNIQISEYVFPFGIFYQERGFIVEGDVWRRIDAPESPRAKPSGEGNFE